MKTFYDESLDGNMETEETKICVMKRSGERVPFDRQKHEAHNLEYIHIKEDRG